MELNSFLKQYFNQLSSKNISNKNDFHNYDNFKKFIEEHYQIKHIEIYNYIKYTKVKRQIIKLKQGQLYNFYLNEINKYILKLSEINVFPCININKYLCKINSFYKIYEKRRLLILNNICKMRNIIDLKNDYNFRIKILGVINNFYYKYSVLKKNFNKIEFLIDKLLKLESSYGIDHNLIKMNNQEHDILGKKSEYTVNKIITKFIDKSDKTYIYEKNIDLLRLFQLSLDNSNSIKGEIDGIIFYKENDNYIIYKIIEVKSSIKSIFDDLKKFISLQKFINNLSFENDYYFKNYKFNKESFKNIIDKKITEWVTYICINNIHKDAIEKSHLYFSSVLKIVDDEFIKEYYVNNNKNIIYNKYKIILENKELIDNIFNNWKKLVDLDNNCNIFISKIF